MRLTLRPRRHRHHSNAQSVVEFALIAPLFILLFLFAIDFGRLFFTYIQVSNAAREATAYGATQPTDIGGMTVRAQQEKNSQSQGEPAFEALQTTCRNTTGTVISCASAPGGGGAGNTLTVVVTQPFQFLSPFMNTFFPSLRVSASATTAVLVSAVGGTGGGSGSCAAPSNATFTVVTNGLDVIVNPDGSKPDTGVCTISGYNWDFGDGTTGVGSSIPLSHTYGSPGTYSILLQVTNQGGSLTAVRSVTVPDAGPTPTPTASPSGTPAPTATATPAPTPTATPCPKPDANFSWTSSGKTKSFLDGSQAPAECPITTWLWDFDDGSMSNAPNPTHTYQGNNAHDVTLTVTSSAGSTTITRRVN